MRCTVDGCPGGCDHNTLTPSEVRCSRWTLALCVVGFLLASLIEGVPL